MLHNIVLILALIACAAALNIRHLEQAQLHRSITPEQKTQVVAAVDTLKATLLRILDGGDAVTTDAEEGQEDEDESGDDEEAEQGEVDTQKTENVEDSTTSAPTPTADDCNQHSRAKYSGDDWKVKCKAAGCIPETKESLKQRQDEWKKIPTNNAKKAKKFVKAKCQLAA